MRDRVGGTPKRRRRAAAVLATAAALLTSCSTAIDGSPVTSAGGPPPGTVDIALLDVGNYPTRPSAPIGTAGTPEIGAIVEGQRMANYVTGPWEVDPSLIGHYADSALCSRTPVHWTSSCPRRWRRSGSDTTSSPASTPRATPRTARCCERGPALPRPARRRGRRHRVRRGRRDRIRAHPAGDARTDPRPPRSGELQPRPRAGPGREPDRRACIHGAGTLRARPDRRGHRPRRGRRVDCENP